MKFEVKVLSGNQQVSILTIDAINEPEAVAQARQQGFSVVSSKPQSPQTQRFSRGAKFPLVLFSHELLSLLDAGLGLMDAMETLREKEHRVQIRSVLDQLMAALNEGQPLSGAMAKVTDVFPPLYIALVRSSEKTGSLAEALKRFVDYQVQVDVVRKKVVSASIYPAILMMVGGLVIAFLLLYVVPKFSVIFESKGSDLPWLSILLLGWGQLLHEHALTVLIGFIALTGVIAYGLSRPAFRQALLAWLLKFPALGERMRVYQLARFYRTLGMLLRGGIPALTALQMVAGLLQPGLRNSLQLAQQDVKEGVSLSTAMEHRGLTTPVAVRMMRVGEHTGQMGDMMERIGAFYDDEVARWVDWFTRLFEPLLMTFIGLVIGVIVVLMYMPIFELAGSLQ